MKVERHTIFISVDDAAALREDTPLAADETGQLYANGTAMSTDGAPGTTGDTLTSLLAHSLGFVGMPDDTPISASPHRGPSDDSLHCFVTELNDASWNQPWTAWSNGTYGTEKRSAWGNIVGKLVADALGSAGLTNAGTQTGGGYVRTGDFGHLDTLNKRDGQGLGVAIDIASQSPLVEKSFRPGSISEQTSANAVQQTIERSYWRFRLCYESGVRRDPLLAGNVRIRFAIGSDGSTFDVNEEGSSLRDEHVVACVLGVFREMSFPPPSEGMVRLTYPVVLTRSVR
jgi:hypothetical protein